MKKSFWKWIQYISVVLLGSHNSKASKQNFDSLEYKTILGSNSIGFVYLALKDTEINEAGQNLHKTPRLNNGFSLLLKKIRNFLVTF